MQAKPKARCYNPFWRRVQRCLPGRYANPHLQPSINASALEPPQLSMMQATNQETGGTILLGAHLYPTMERTQIDLTQPALKEWNRKCFRVASSLAAEYYKRMLMDLLRETLTTTSGQVVEWPKARLVQILAWSTFEKSPPNQQVGECLKSAFLNDKLPLPCIHRGQCQVMPLCDVFFLPKAIGASFPTALLQDVPCISAFTPAKPTQAYLSLPLRLSMCSQQKRPSQDELTCTD